MKRLSTLGCLVVLLATTTSAHVMVSPPQSKAGATQTYELRVHNEGKVATIAVELQIPKEVTVTHVQASQVGTVDTPMAGDRITAINWKVDVAPSKYVALKFDANNPTTNTELHWNVRQRLADGSVVEWSDAPGSKEKASITKVGSGSADDAHDGAAHDHPHD